MLLVYYINTDKHFLQGYKKILETKLLKIREHLLLYCRKKYFNDQTKLFSFWKNNSLFSNKVRSLSSRFVRFFFTYKITWIFMTKLFSFIEIASSESLVNPSFFAETFVFLSGFKSNRKSDTIGKA